MIIIVIINYLMNLKFDKILILDFRKQSSLARHDTLRIEYQLRMGRRKIEMIRDPNTADMGQFVDK